MTQHNFQTSKNEIQDEE